MTGADDVIRVADTTLRFQPLDGKAHDRAAFACGHPALDRYLKEQAGQERRRRIAVTWVLAADRMIAGYYTLSNASVVTEDLVKAGQSLPGYVRTPVTLIGRLARDLRYRGGGIGELLLVDALRRSLLGAAAIGSTAVVVDAIDEHAAAFYAGYGFLELPDDDGRLFLPMATVAKLFAG